MQKKSKCYSHPCMTAKGRSHFLSILELKHSDLAEVRRPQRNDHISSAKEKQFSYHNAELDGIMPNNGISTNIFNIL